MSKARSARRRTGILGMAGRVQRPVSPSRGRHPEPEGRRGPTMRLPRPDDRGGAMFLKTPPEDKATAALYKEDLESDGYVMNLTRLWAWRPDVAKAFIELRKMLMSGSALSPRERAVIVCAT